MDRKAVLEAIETHMRCDRHYEVARLVRESLPTQPGLQNDVVSLYLERGERVSFHAYEDFCRAAEYLPLGLSERIRERMLSDFVEVGYRERALRLAEDLGRKLSVREVQQIAEVYTHGSLRSDREETELKTLAFDVGGMFLEEWIMRQLVSMHVRWEQEMPTL